MDGNAPFIESPEALGRVACGQVGEKKNLKGTLSRLAGSIRKTTAQQPARVCHVPETDDSDVKTEL